MTPILDQFKPRAPLQWGGRLLLQKSTIYNKIIILNNVTNKNGKLLLKHAKTDVTQSSDL